MAGGVSDRSTGGSFRFPVQYTAHSASVVFALFLIFQVSCVGITEYDSVYSGRLLVVSSEDLNIVGGVADILGASSLLVCRYGVFVASIDGTVYGYELETLELHGISTVGLPSAAGYSDMVYSSLERSAYLIGILGTILELDLPECRVVDEFSVCQSPVSLALGSGSHFHYVADGPSNRIYQLSIENNIPYTSTQINGSVLCMEPGRSTDSILVGTLYGIALLEVLSPGNIRNTIADDSLPCTALAALHDDSLFVGVKGYRGSSTVGVVDLFNSSPEPFQSYYGAVEIQGDLHFVSTGEDSTHAFVLSHIGDANSRLLSYNYDTFSVERQMDLPGYPVSLSVSDEGLIYILLID